MQQRQALLEVAWGYQEGHDVAGVVGRITKSSWATKVEALEIISTLVVPP